MVSSPGGVTRGAGVWGLVWRSPGGGRMGLWVGGVRRGAAWRAGLREEGPGASFASA
jgi:hypothetical protein